jgi:predicted ATPase/class 3 adenylate cyclase
MRERVPLASGGSPPTGTVTFAFTDIEGSTLRWERDRGAMEEALRRHDALVREAIVSHGGYVFKTIGDAFCAAFPRPQDALSALLDAQRALEAQDFRAVDGLRVRAALHTGTADERDGDYFGHAVNRAARLLTIGHGGQILVSGVTADLVQGALPPQAALCDLGEHRLKDLTRPEHVYQLIAPGLATDFPALRSLDASPNNLPRVATSFVGREAEVAEITELMAKHRLVTLVGSGGIGKTRTALQVAANLIDGDGAWFIELAPLSNGDYLPFGVAKALGLTLATGGDPVESLARALKTKSVLLIFDNCEHLLEAAAKLIATLLGGCPTVRVLASSRQGLGIAGEVTYRMPSLGVPSDAAATHFTALDGARYAATALFAERARAADRSFAVTEENAPIIADICRRLDGIPLAIELAATRVKILTPRQLRERLDERFRVLTGGGRDVMPRQQTLRALIDWSYDLLDERERTLFRRLGIFVNGFTLEGAVAIGGGADLDDLDAFDLLASLVDKSLVLAEPAGEATRYRMLESTRVYAREKLQAAGEYEAQAARHLRYLRDHFAQAGERYEKTVRWGELNDAFSTELADARAALDWAVAGGDTLLGAELFAELRHGWQACGLHREGIARAEAFLAALGDTEPRLVARIWLVIEYLEGNAGPRHRGSAAAAHAVARARACGDPAILAQALTLYSFSALRSSENDAVESALAEAEAIPDATAATRLQLLGARARQSGLLGNLGAQARAYERLRNEHRLLGNLSTELAYTLNLAETEHARGETRRAIAIIEEALPLFRTGGDRIYRVASLANLAGYLAAVDDLAGTRAIAREVIRELALGEPESAPVAQAIEHLALAVALGDDFIRAALLEGYADATFRNLAFKREVTEIKTFDRLAGLLGAGLAAGELAQLLAEGAALTPQAAIALAREDA